MRPKNETILSVLKEPSVPLFGFVYIYLFFTFLICVLDQYMYRILFFHFSQKDNKILDFQALIYFENFKRVVLYY